MTDLCGRPQGHARPDAHGRIDHGVRAHEAAHFDGGIVRDKGRRIDDAGPPLRPNVKFVYAGQPVFHLLYFVQRSDEGDLVRKPAPALNPPSTGAPATVSSASLRKPARWMG